MNHLLNHYIDRLYFLKSEHLEIVIVIQVLKKTFMHTLYVPDKVVMPKYATLI